MSEGVKISELPNATEINGTELVLVVQNGVTKKVTSDTFIKRSAVQVKVNSNKTNSTTTAYEKIDVVFGDTVYNNDNETFSLENGKIKILKDVSAVISCNVSILYNSIVSKEVNCGIFINDVEKISNGTFKEDGKQAFIQLSDYLIDLKANDIVSIKIWGSATGSYGYTTLTALTIKEL